MKEIKPIIFVPLQGGELGDMLSDLNVRDFQIIEKINQLVEAINQKEEK